MLCHAKLVSNHRIMLYSNELYNYSAYRSIVTNSLFLGKSEPLEVSVVNLLKICSLYTWLLPGLARALKAKQEKRIVPIHYE